MSRSPPPSASPLARLSSALEKLTAAAPWAAAYLRDTSAETTLHVLTSPTLLAHSVSSSHAESGVGGTTAPLAPGLDGVGDCSESMLVPHVTLSPLCAGVVVSRHTPLAAVHGTDRLDGDPLPGAVSYHVGRYLLDARTGDMVTVEHDMTTGRTYGFFLGCGGSATRRVRLYFRCNTDRFVAGGSVAEVVDWIAKADEARECVVCGRAAAARCGCRLRVILPTGPASFMAAAVGLTHHIGAFEGRLRVVQGVGGKEVASREVECFVHIRGFSRFAQKRVGKETHRRLVHVLQGYAVQWARGSFASVGSPVFEGLGGGGGAGWGVGGVEAGSLSLAGAEGCEGVGVGAGVGLLERAVGVEVDYDAPPRRPAFRFDGEVAERPRPHSADAQLSAEAESAVAAAEAGLMLHPAAVAAAGMVVAHSPVTPRSTPSCGSGVGERGVAGSVAAGEEAAGLGVSPLDALPVDIARRPVQKRTPEEDARRDQRRRDKNRASAMRANMRRGIVLEELVRTHRRKEELKERYELLAEERRMLIAQLGPRQ